MRTRWTTFAALNALLAVALGAFAAHGLKNHVDASRLPIFETGVRFHMYHAFALLAAAWVISAAPSRPARLAATFFQLGILLFSGSLYVLTLFPAKWIGPITPVGGVCLMIGWLLLAVGAWPRRSLE